MSVWVQQNMSLYVGCSCFFHGFDLTIVWWQEFTKYDIIAATLNIRIFPTMLETGRQTCMRVWCVIERKMREKHANFVKVRRSSYSRFGVFIFSFEEI